jgi:nuclear GTP-binding protein
MLSLFIVLKEPFCLQINDACISVNRKPIQIPNICPFKEKIIAEVEALKAMQEKEREEKRLQAKEDRTKQKELVTKSGLEGLVSSAEKRGSQHEGAAASDYKEFPGIFTDTSVKTFYKEFKKVLSNSDVILEVLDARDPLGTRCPTVEKEVVEVSRKKLVIVLNKAGSF